MGRQKKWWDWRIGRLWRLEGRRNVKLVRMICGARSDVLPGGLVPILLWSHYFQDGILLGGDTANNEQLILKQFTFISVCVCTCLCRGQYRTGKNPTELQLQVLAATWPESRNLTLSLNSVTARAAGLQALSSPETNPCCQVRTSRGQKPKRK